MNLSCSGAHAAPSYIQAIRGFSNLNAYYQAKQKSDLLCRSRNTSCAYYASYLFLPVAYPSITKQYLSDNRLKVMIERNKLGLEMTDHFLEFLIEHVVPVLKTANFSEDDYPIQEMLQQKDELLSLSQYKDKDFHSLATEDIKKALVEIAWNAFLPFTADSDQQFQLLLDYIKQLTDEGPTILHFASFTNYPNCHKIFSHHKLEVSELQEKPYNKEAPYCEIGANIRLSTSYQAQSYKITPDKLNDPIPTQAKEVTTPCLIKQAEALYPSNRFDVTVISQYEGDLRQAQECGFAIQRPDEFFEQIKTQSPKMKMA